MDHINIILSAVLINFTILIFIIAVFSYRRRKAPGAQPLFLLCLATAFYTFGYSMEILSQTIEEVDFRSKFQYIGIPFIPAMWVMVSIFFANDAKKYIRTFTFFFSSFRFLPAFSG